MYNKNEAVYVICEYNPFHKGHKYQIDYLKRYFSTVVCLMSGNTVQRGECSIADKYVRAKAAVMCGADIVFELPFPFSCMAAHDFAEKGVELARLLGAENLAFGIEDDFETVAKISNVLYDKRKLKEIIKREKNLSYPKACELLVGEVLGSDAVEAVKKPNNILAAEYIRHTNRYGIVPFPVKRAAEFSSSTQIRKKLYKNDPSAYDDMPVESAAVYKELSSSLFPRDIRNIGSAILASIRFTGGSKDVYGIDSGVFKRIYNASLECGTYDRLIEKCVSATSTTANIKRAVLASFLDITPNDSLKKPEFALLLAASKNGCRYIRSRSPYFKIPVITKPAHILKSSLNTKAIFANMCLVENVLTLSEPFPGAALDQFSKTPFIKP